MFRLIIETNRNEDNDLEKFLDRLDCDYFSDTEYIYYIDNKDEDLLYNILHALKQLNIYFYYNFSMEVKEI